ncbi:Hpt domain-containing protein [Alteromonas sp. KUL42]|uniref:Hpt domain-containing protein n=1 Tax=Alteromonas sp. KUL42 TaxID=2480797 RepID=UPI00384F0D2A
MNDYPDKKAKLQQALHDGNREDIRFYAHTIKGNLGDIGASKGRQYFEEIEKNALNTDVKHLSALFVKAENTLQHTIALFNDELEHS